MKKIVALLFVMVGIINFAQEVDADGNLKTDSRKFLSEDAKDGRLEGWYISGNNSIMFNQAAFSNWVAGGVNSYSLGANIDYEFNLTRGKHIWDNRILLGYGVLKNEGETSRKSNDIIDLTSAYGYEIGNSWYAAAGLNFTTQFAEGFDFNSQDSITGDYKKISNLMAPGYLTIGFGVDYKPNENFQVNIHPLTSKMTFVLDEDLQTAGSFGLKNDGDSFLYQFGAYLGARYKLPIMDNISYDSRLGLFANYLDDFGNVDVAYQGILDLKVNRFISAQATINLFYDDDQLKRTQVKQTLGIGFNYKFDNTEKLKAEQPIETIPPVITPDQPVSE